MYSILYLYTGFIALLNIGSPPIKIVVQPYTVLLEPFASVLADIQSKVIIYKLLNFTHNYYIHFVSQRFLL